MQYTIHMSELAPNTASDKDDLQGRQYITQLFAPDSGITYSRVLDTRGYKQEGPEVFEVGIAKNATPTNLGEWPENETLGIPSTPGEWVIPPERETSMAAKILSRSYQLIGEERKALLLATSRFPSEASCRPIQIHAYGIGSITHNTLGSNHEVAYLLLELIGKEYRPLHEHLNEHQPTAKSMTHMAINICSMLRELHHLGVGHGDLESSIGDKSGKEAHIFVDDKSGHIRVIDWSHSISRDRDSKRFGLVTDFDHMGVGQLLQYANFSDESSEVQAQLKKILELSKVVDLEESSIADVDSSPAYERSAEGTDEQYTDLRTLLTMLDGSPS